MFFLHPFLSSRWRTFAMTVFGLLLSAPAARAQSGLINTMRENIINSTILQGANEDPEQVIGILLVGLFSLLGIIFLILVISGGYRWMTARGNEEQIAQAKKIIASASIGLAVVLSAYLVTFAIFEFFTSQNLVNVSAPTS